MKGWLNEGGFLFVNYDKVRFIEEYLDRHSINDIDVTIFDEAQNLKNNRAQRTELSRSIGERSKSRILLTGTPLENSITEFLNLIYLANYDVYSRASKSTQDPEVFSRSLITCYLRRKRDDVLTELPEKNEVIEYLEGNNSFYDEYSNQLYSEHYMRLRSNISTIGKESNPKMLRIKEIVEGALSEGRKVLIFTTYLEVQDQIGRMFPKVYRIDGSVDAKIRQQTIDHFSSDKSCHILTCQTKTGGVGLNIQSASVVIICEPQFNPAVEDQAISRSYRMGQSSNVFVYKLAIRNTFEERVIQILFAKREEFKKFADNSLAKDLVKFDDLIQEERARYKKVA